MDHQSLASSCLPSLDLGDAVMTTLKDTWLIPPSSFPTIGGSWPNIGGRSGGATALHRGLKRPEGDSSNVID